MNSEQLKGNWKQFVGRRRSSGASLLMTTGRLSRVSVISLLGRSKSATELPARKPSVS